LDGGSPVTIGEIVLDRPEKRNALTPAMLASIVDAAAAFDRDDTIRAVLLRGEGKLFCSGFDLSLCRDDHAALAAMLAGLSAAIRALRRCSRPVIIGAHGGAIAGGAALLGAADLVVADAHCRIGYPVANLGISPAVSAPSLALLAGNGAARERLLDTALIDGARARELGMVHIVVPIPEDVTPRAQIEATRLGQKPPAAARATKRWLNEVDGSAADAAFDRALDASLAPVDSAEQRARLARLWSS
jgi:methylglutaconyl-CoA hydratase